MPDASDLCPGTAPAAPVDANGCSTAQVDTDADGDCNPGAPSGGPGNCTGSDNCPSWVNPAQNLPPWNVPLNDPDCDNFTTASEMFIGTDPGRQCAATGVVTNPPAGGLNDEPPPDRWPTDFNDNQISNTIDVGQFVPRLNSTAPGPPYNVRFDFNASNNINTIDVGRFVQLLNKTCS